MVSPTQRQTKDGIVLFYFRKFILPPAHTWRLKEAYTDIKTIEKNEKNKLVK